MRAIRQGVAHYRAHQTILQSNQLSNWVYTIHSGWALSCILLPDGRRQIISFLVPGDTISFASLFQKPSNTLIKALTDITLCAFDAQKMKSLLLRPGGPREAFDTAFSVRIIDMMHRLTDIGRRRAPGRVANFLLGLERRLSACGLAKNGVFAFPARQEHIADALGLTPVHVNRTLVQLRKLGVINFRKGMMEIIDRAGLQKIADED